MFQKVSSFLLKSLKKELVSKTAFSRIANFRKHQLSKGKGVIYQNTHISMKIYTLLLTEYCVKSVIIRNFFGSMFSRIQAK